VGAAAEADDAVKTAGINPPSVVLSTPFFGLIGELSDYLAEPIEADTAMEGQVAEALDNSVGDVTRMRQAVADGLDEACGVLGGLVVAAATAGKDSVPSAEELLAGAVAQLDALPGDDEESAEGGGSKRSADRSADDDADEGTGADTDEDGYQEPTTATVSGNAIGGAGSSPVGEIGQQPTTRTSSASGFMPTAGGFNPTSPAMGLSTAAPVVGGGGGFSGMMGQMPAPVGAMGAPSAAAGGAPGVTGAAGGASQPGGLRRSEVQQMVDDARRRIAAERAQQSGGDVKQSSSPKTEPTAQRSRPTPSAPSGGATLGDAKPSSWSSGKVENESSGAKLTPENTRGRTIAGGVAPPAPAAGAATNTTAAAPAGGSSGGDSKGGMGRGMGMAPMMGAMGRGMNGGQSGGKDGNSGSGFAMGDTVIRSNDPLVNGRWLQENATQGGIITPGRASAVPSAASPQAGSSNDSVPRKGKSRW